MSGTRISRHFSVEQFGEQLPQPPVPVADVFVVIRVVDTQCIAGKPRLMLAEQAALRRISGMPSAIFSWSSTYGLGKLLMRCIWPRHMIMFAISAHATKPSGRAFRSSIPQDRHSKPFLPGGPVRPDRMKPVRAAGRQTKSTASGFAGDAAGTGSRPPVPRRQRQRPKSNIVFPLVVPHHVRGPP